MEVSRIGLALAAAAALGACEAKIGDRADAGNESASAEGKAEEGRIAIKAPGLDLSIDVPKRMTDRAKTHHDNRLLYPGANISGLYIAGGAGREGDQGEVELRFATPDAPDAVAAWYRDPARGGDFRIDEASREGDGVVITGREVKDKQQFKLRIAPRAGGGTDGRLTLRDRG